MRLWSLHPRYLDAKGLVALWREALLAQAVLRGRTKGYVGHPQLARFRGAKAPLRCIAAYLRAVRDEAERRGYDFDARRIGRGGPARRIEVTRGQLRYERDRLLQKLAGRDPERCRRLASVRRIDPHPLFRVVPGGIEEWEKAPDLRK